MTGRRSVALLLDEMFPSALAEALRSRGHDVIAVVDHVELRAGGDAAVFEWAAQTGRRILTENVKDYRPLLQRALDSRAPRADLLLTSSRTFPRSRRSPRPLIDALDHWLTSSRTATRSFEEWLPTPSTDQP